MSHKRTGQRYTRHVTFRLSPRLLKQLREAAATTEERIPELIRASINARLEEIRAGGRRHEIELPTAEVADRAERIRLAGFEYVRAVAGDDMTLRAACEFLRRAIRSGAAR